MSLKNTFNYFVNCFNDFCYMEVVIEKQNDRYYRFKIDNSLLFRLNGQSLKTHQATLITKGFNTGHVKINGCPIFIGLNKTGCPHLLQMSNLPFIKCRRRSRIAGFVPAMPRNLFCLNKSFCCMKLRVPHR